MTREILNTLAVSAGAGFLVLLVLWFCGSLLLRVFGVLNLIAAATMLVLLASADLLYDYPAAWFSTGITIAYGLTAWLGGHWLYARKYGFYKSALAWRMLHPLGRTRRPALRG